MSKTPRHMKSAAIRADWKNVLDAVQNGQEIVVELYNRPVARIIPYTETPMNQPPAEEALAEDTAASKLAAGRAVLTDRIAKWKAQQEVWQNMPTSALDQADLLRIEFEQHRQGEVEDLLDEFDAATARDTPASEAN